LPQQFGVVSRSDPLRDAALYGFCYAFGEAEFLTYHGVEGELLSGLDVFQIRVLEEMLITFIKSLSKPSFIGLI
jgi:hypothetical protein